MIIALPDGSRITLSTKSDSAGGALTLSIPGSGVKPVSFGQQLRRLLAQLGDDAARVHLETLNMWCRHALDRDSRSGFKAKPCNRKNWARSLDVIEMATVLADEQAEAA